MSFLSGAVGLGIIAFVLWDTFETILLPRRIPSRWRISRFVLGALWRLWAALGARIRRRAARENFLGLYALLSLIGLLMVWAGGIVLGYALLHVAAATQLAAADTPMSFGIVLYMSATTFFTLGLGDVSPLSGAARAITAVEAGNGLGFLALVLAYLPVLYQQFSRREVRITMLDEWAGSPPSAAVILRRCFESRAPGSRLDELLRDWEQTAAGILESHLSYPILAYFRSQHDNQSWLAAISAILDTCALVITGVDGIDPFQARLTFAICRHTLVDIKQSVDPGPNPEEPSAAAEQGLAELRAWLEDGGVPVARGAEADHRLAELRALYLPYVRSLARLLLIPMPDWLPPARTRYNWETTAWAKTSFPDGHEH